MIEPTRRKLTILFTFAILTFNFATLAVIAYYSHDTLNSLLENRLRHEVEEDLLDYYARKDFEGFSNLLEADLFQLIDRRGRVAYASKNPLKIKPPVRPDLVRLAFDGGERFERIQMEGGEFLDYYVHIDDRYVGRGVSSVEMLSNFEKAVGLMALLGLPVIFILSFFISSYLVRRALVPIRDVFTFQESFSSNVTHELMSPLTSMKGNLEVTLRKPRTTEDYQSALKLGLNEVDRIIDLLKNLFMLASSKFKPLDLLQEPVSISDLIAEITEAESVELNEKQITLEKTGEQSLICQCDQTLIRRSLVNLWENAVKYTPPGGSIKIHTETWGPQAIIRISNSVEAAPDPNPDRLFEPFVRGENHATGNTKGRGLGLYISRYIARSHGGDLQLQKDPGRFTVVLSLPLSPTQSRTIHPERQRRYGQTES